MRIVHLIEPGWPGGEAFNACALKVVATLIGRQRGHRHEVVVLGDRRGLEAARQCGLRPWKEHVGAARWWPLAGRGALRRLLGPVDDSTDPFQIVHAWSPRTALLASIVFPHRPRRATLLSGPATFLETRLLAARMVRAPMPIVVPSNAVAQEWIAANVPEQLIQIIALGIEWNEAQQPSRSEVRQRWSEESPLDDRTLVVAMLNEPADRVDARAAYEIAGRVTLSGRDIRMALHPRCARRAEAMRFARRLGLEDVVIFDEQISLPWRVLAGVDAVVWMSDTRPNASAASVLAALWACAAGVPLVTTDCPALRAIFVGDDPPVMLIGRGDVNAASAAIADIADHRQKAHDRAVAAARRVRQACSAAEFAEKIGAIDDDLMTQWSFQRVMPEIAPMILSDPQA